MTISLFFLTIAAVVYLSWNLVRALSKTRRSQALRRAKWSGLLFALGLVVFVIAAAKEQDAEAIALGFHSAEDRRAAEQANFNDAASWKAHIAELADKARRAKAEADAAALEETRQATERAAREKAEAEARLVEQQRAEAEAAAIAESERLAAETAQEAACRRDLSCWGEKAFITASVSCPKIVERMAKYTSEWTDGWLDMKFSRYRWKDVDRGIVTVIGDKIRFQNGFGAWQNMIYECDVDPVSKKIFDVRVRDGRL